MSADMTQPILTRYTVRPARTGVPDTTWYVLRDAAGPLPLPRTMAVCDRQADADDVAAGLALLEAACDRELDVDDVIAGLALLKAARTGTAAADVTGAPI